MNVIKCLKCSGKLKGRSDKKFCDQYCRNAYHNGIYREDNVLMKGVNQILKRNRRILKQLFQNVEISSKTDLIGLGYNFDYYTNMYTSRKNQVHYFCYDYGILPLDDGFFALIQNQLERSYSEV